MATATTVTNVIPDQTRTNVISDRTSISQALSEGGRGRGGEREKGEVGEKTRGKRGGRGGRDGGVSDEMERRGGTGGGYGENGKEIGHRTGPPNDQSEQLKSTRPAPASASLFFLFHAPFDGLLIVFVAGRL